MSTIEIWLIGLALAIDCFTVSIAAGLQARQVRLLPMAFMALSFGIFQAGMTWLGYLGLSLFAHMLEQIDHWIAFSLLAYLGGRMIWEDLHPGSEPSGSSPMLTTRRILVLSVATSIDALAVGISFAVMKVDIAIAALSIGFITFFCSLAGTWLGKKFGSLLGRFAEIFGGCILVGIGLKIFIEHMF